MTRPRHPWTEQRGGRPYTVTIYERPDRGWSVWLRWTYRGRRHARRSTVGSVRDDRGRLLARLQDEVRREADELVTALSGGREALRRGYPATLREGIAAAFSLRGPYPDASSRWAREARALLERVVPHLGGEGALWAELTPGRLREAWRRLMRERPEAAPTWAEKPLVVLFRVANWLASEYPQATYPRPTPGWRQELRRDWARMRGRTHRPARPRYSPEEVRRLYAALGSADPRLRLALFLGPELRSGQLLRAMRSDLDLQAAPQAPHGRLRVPYVSAKKRAPVLVLSALERAAIDHELESGYLRDLELAYRAGSLADYPLFPSRKGSAGRFPRRGVFRADRAYVPMTQKTLVALLHELERKAGVAYVRGRGWHGLRRAFADLYPSEAHVHDDRILDALGGWAPGSDVRERIYQEGESPEVAWRAAEIRAQMRRRLGLAGAASRPEGEPEKRPETSTAIEASGRERTEADSGPTTLSPERTPETATETATTSSP